MWGCGRPPIAPRKDKAKQHACCVILNFPNDDSKEEIIEFTCLQHETFKFQFQPRFVKVQESSQEGFYCLGVEHDHKWPISEENEDEKKQELKSGIYVSRKSATRYQVCRLWSTKHHTLNSKTTLSKMIHQERLFDIHITTQ
jgi:hypothetical protein